MRARVGITTRNRLQRSERAGLRQQYVGGWPPLMGVDEWELLASSMQDELTASAHFAVQDQPARVELPLPIRTADDGEKLPPARSTIDDYLAAQQAIREARAEVLREAAYFGERDRTSVRC